MRLFSCIYLSIYSFGPCVDVDEPSNKFSSRGGGGAAAVEFACSIPIDQWKLNCVEKSNVME